MIWGDLGWGRYNLPNHTLSYLPEKSNHNNATKFGEDDPKFWRHFFYEGLRSSATSFCQPSEDMNPRIQATDFRNKKKQSVALIACPNKVHLISKRLGSISDTLDFLLYKITRNTKWTKDNLETLIILFNILHHNMCISNNSIICHNQTDRLKITTTKSHLPTEKHRF